MTTDPMTDTASNRQRVKAYLRTEATDRDGDLYVKSREAAAATGLTAKQVGTLIGQLQREAPDLRIERWAYSNATTWRIEAV